MNLAAWGAWLLAAGVALGAFGAHGLRELVASERLATWQTAVHYHLAHALGLLATAGLEPRLPTGSARRVGMALIAGVVLFSGSLYALVLTDQRWLGAITPFGGLAFIAGWILLALAARRPVES